MKNFNSPKSKIRWTQCQAFEDLGINQKWMVRFLVTDYWQISCEGMQLTVFVCFGSSLPGCHLEDSKFLYPLSLSVFSTRSTRLYCVKTILPFVLHFSPSSLFLFLSFALFYLSKWMLQEVSRQKAFLINADQFELFSLLPFSLSLNIFYLNSQAEFSQFSTFTCHADWTN